MTPSWTCDLLELLRLGSSQVQTEPGVMRARHAAANSSSIFSAVELDRSATSSAVRARARPGRQPAARPPRRRRHGRCAAAAPPNCSHRLPLFGREVGRCRRRRSPAAAAPVWPPSPGCRAATLADHRPAPLATLLARRPGCAPGCCAPAAALPGVRAPGALRAWLPAAARPRPATGLAAAARVVIASAAEPRVPRPAAAASRPSAVYMSSFGRNRSACVRHAQRRSWPSR